MAQRSIDAVRSKELKILPETFENTWCRWLEDIRNWCISRQLWWGHRIPSYFVCSDEIPAGNETDDQYWVSAHTDEEAPDKASKKLNTSKDKICLKQDEGVLDTWFSSSLLSFSSFGWTMEADDFKIFFPTTLLETSHYILFSWVARMVMMSLELTDRLPFTEVYLHAIVRDADECKMSQTLGNVINPLDFIHDISLEKLQEGFESSKEDYPYGIPECRTDALRFAVCDYAAQGQYINLSRFRVEGSRDFCNDLWNVIRFAMSKNLDINDSNCFLPPTEFTLTGTETRCDLWILSRLSYAIEQCESAFKMYQFRQIIAAIYNFWFPELNDIYIQYIKKYFYPEKPNLEQQNRQNTIKLILYTCLNNGLRLTAPIMPYLSEELYQRLPKPNNGQNSSPSLCFNQYRNKIIEKYIGIITNAIDKINSHYSTPGILPHEAATLYIKSSSSTSALFKEYLELIGSLTNIDNIQILNDEPTADQKEYIHIATTSDYKLYFKLNDDLE